MAYNREKHRRIGVNPMKMVLAPDSFKGSLSARELCRAWREGILAACPEAEVVELPLADGGEGTVKALVQATGGECREKEVRDPLGRRVRAGYGVLGDGETAVIEMAEASGLTRLAPDERNPLIADSYGTGELIRAALDDGIRRVIIGLGGSATNDGGTGALRALGVRFLDAAGRELPPGGESLLRLERIDLSGLANGVRETAFVLAGDVTNPLCGPSGASAVFGPQKGADPDMVKQLDRALARYRDVLCRTVGRDIGALPGSGAAGGAGAGFMAILGADMQAGIDLVLEAVEFDRHVQGADWIVTGEGKLDAQTGSGKVVAGVSRAAAGRGIPVIALCGSVELEGHEVADLGLAAAFSIVPGPCSPEEAMAEAGPWARHAMEQLARTLVLQSVENK